VIAAPCLGVVGEHLPVGDPARALPRDSPSILEELGLA
jgi:hypothetical protein